MKASERLLEQVLVLRCQLGDKGAFAELIDRYQRPVRYFINRMLENSQITEDIYQDTWLAVIRRIHSLRQPDAFSTWLYRIARNKVYQHLRKKTRFRPLDDNMPLPNKVELEVSLSEDVAKLHRCLKKLQPEHREVLMLRFLEQMSYQQMADVLNCNAGTVKSRIYYAKQALKQEMEE